MKKYWWAAALLLLYLLWLWWMGRRLRSIATVGPQSSSFREVAFVPTQKQTTAFQLALLRPSATVL